MSAIICHQATESGEKVQPPTAGVKQKGDNL
jgi:hypothetical protein